MNPSLQNMNLALAVIAFRALARLNEIEFKSLSSNLTNFFSAIKEKLPEYEVQISNFLAWQNAFKGAREYFGTCS